VKIIVNTQKEKEKLLEESEYVYDYIKLLSNFNKAHDAILLDARKTWSLIHIHKHPEMIEIKKN